MTRKKFEVYWLTVEKSFWGTVKNGDEIEEQIKQLGLDGWELISAIPDTGHSNFGFIFQREILP